MSNLPTITDARLWELWRQADNMDTVEFNVAFGRLVAEEAVRLEREAIFEQVCQWEDGSFMKLHAGEMSAQEFRTAKAVVVAIRSAIRARSQEGQG